MLVIHLLGLVLGALSIPLCRHDMSHDHDQEEDKARFPADEQTPEQQAAFTEAERRVKEVYGSSFKLKDDHGNLLGPFGILSYAPTTFLPFLNYTQSYATLPSLTPKERELSVLATASVTKSVYILYAHKSIAVTVGLTPKQAQDASEGEIPEHLAQREQFVYRLALKMATDFGVISDEVFGDAVTEIGREGVAQLAQVVGGYLSGSILVSVADVGLPSS
ncbi:hypothetical protein K458DRAFT_419072 [Lentithecium fluviatile CBS 122367]|uniref:Uncharacterized protein n=1 Tax=Lentithecium fluviatile CBS 122367 TaxID=1168545 RepID=A0A6G1J005_9PLEO|nr:hypothetical protein K458DRAFT_419072 [Lentithecium fluviatile CBS 122367]